MADSVSSSSEQQTSKITFEVNLDTNEVEIKYKDNPTWSHITKWNCEVVPAPFDIHIHKELHSIRSLQKTCDGCLDVTLARIRRRKRCLIFTFGHDTLDDAVQMATKFVEVKNKILEFFQEIDAKVTDISLRCWVGELNGSSEQLNKNADGLSIKGESNLFSCESKGYKSKTDWFCKLEKDEFEMDPTSSSNIFTKLKRMFDNSYPCILNRVIRGSLIIQCEHESREDALEMLKNHVKVKATILECLHEMDPRVNAITVEVEYKETATPTPADRDLLEASREGNMAAVKQILAEGRADVNCRDEDRRTPVMWVAYKGHREVVEILVSGGADVSLVDEGGDNILHFACSGGDVETVQFVLSLNVVDINSRGGKSRTPVMVAAWWGHRDVVELLVSEGADVSLVDVDGYNILHHACSGGDVETVKCVLSLNVVDIYARNNDGRTAADMARLRGHKEVVKLL